LYEAQCIATQANSCTRKSTGENDFVKLFPLHTPACCPEYDLDTCARAPKQIANYYQHTLSAAADTTLLLCKDSDGTHAEMSTCTVKVVVVHQDAVNVDETHRDHANGL
jgi:hypothetical protein